jgi:predicted DNA-binding protein
MAEERRHAAISARIYPSLKAKLEELAKAEGRTLAQYLERVLLAHVDHVDEVRRK